MRQILEIRDPIHGPIVVFEDEMKVIDSPFVQRLRNIKQTGFAELAFPGATHVRYAHSLGAFHLAGRAFDQVFQDFEWKDSHEKRKFRSLLRMAGLLHDVGHGPYSHAIEQAMPLKKDLIGGEGQATHEDYTEAIILKSSLTELLKSIYGIEMPTAIVSLVRNENRLPDFFMAGPQGSLNLFPILSCLISGELDVDRMDYMVRDSLYCGIPYGHFDRDWIFSHMHRMEKNRNIYLALDSRAIYAFEDFLLSRYHLYLMVYLHRKSVIYDEMLYQFIQTDENKTRLPSSVDEYLAIDDFWLQMKLRQSKNPWAKRIVEQRPYKMLLELHSDQTEDTRAYADRLETKLKESNIKYFRSSSTGLLSKYAVDRETQTPIYVLYRDPRFTSAQTPGATSELLRDATDLFARYKNKRIIDRIYAETHLDKF